MRDDASLIILNPTSDADLGDHSVTIDVLLESYPTLHQALEISFKIVPELSTHRNLQVGVSTACTGSPTNLNLLNSSVKALQSGYWANYNTAAN